MKKFWYILMLIVMQSITLNAQPDCPCCTEWHKQFDFWIGEWEVYDTAGTRLGENTITKLEDNCLLSEHWVGAKGYTGRSYNFFNTKDSTWNQLWLDNAGGHLKLNGRLIGEKMILKSELLKGQQVDWYYNQITWTPLKDGAVEQLWEIFDKENSLIMVAFKGIYRKK